MMLDFTHDADRTSWIESANTHEEFPLQNLPLCSFARDAASPRRLGVGIGDQILDLSVAVDLFEPAWRSALHRPHMNELMGWPAAQRLAFRQRISTLLEESCAELRDDTALRESALVDQHAVQFGMPCEVSDYTDFYASVYHATNVGSMFRPDNPLLPNYKHIPIGYHGRSSSLLADAASIRRPRGQLSPAEEGGSPEFGPCRLLDYEMEMGFFVAQGNDLGQPIPLDLAPEHLFGFCLVNDWSARDLQKWEYQPLGPFLAKSFATSLSPWVVMTEALAPFRCPAFERPAGDPQPLEYLASASEQSSGLVDIEVQVHLQSEQMRNQGLDPMRLSRGNFRDMYWTPAQMLAHHSVAGCNLQPGDLLASGTISGRARDSRGCLLELTWDGELDNPVPGSQRTPIELPTGEQRKFLADGDRVIMTGKCHREGYRSIGFGQCEGTIAPAIA